MADLSFTLTDDLLHELKALDSAFSEAYAELKLLPAEELTHLNRYARISMIGSSTRIENALLTDLEVNWMDTILTDDGKVTAFDQNRQLIENKLSKDRERSIEEVAGCRAMLLQIYENPKDFFPLREHDIRALHHTLLSPHSQATHFAGQYKTQSNSVVEQNHKTGENRTVFETAPAGPMTATAMADLVDWYNNNLEKTLWPIAHNVEFIYRFLAIHPFQDGNGRLGRGLFLLSLLHARMEAISFVAPYLSIDRYIEKHKEEYYFVLNRCSDGKFKQDPKRYKIKYFLAFMIKILHEALAGIDSTREKFRAEKNLHDTAVTVLQCFKNFPEVRLTTKDILIQTALPRRTIIYALTKLLDVNLIQKYGDKRSSRYQLTF